LFCGQKIIQIIPPFKNPQFLAGRRQHFILQREKVGEETSGLCYLTQKRGLANIQFQPLHREPGLAAVPDLSIEWL
jgi:hypothetical protein